MLRFGQINAVFRQVDRNQKMLITHCTDSYSGD
ncbi:Uncharacterised protein [Vibrio cholerae]|nr:Uncharacterised protein [Vibrio cholerae]